MNIYLLHQHKVNGYDTYDSCVVVAEDEYKARQYHPNGNLLSEEARWHVQWPDSSWPEHPEDIYCVFMGVADDSFDAGIVCASFNAG